MLLLWDRLLGYDSLDLLPVLAAAVLVFRANLVMQVGCRQDEAKQGGAVEGAVQRYLTLLVEPHPSFGEQTSMIY